jgi:predicted nucleic acid-binding protein
MRENRNKKHNIFLDSNVFISAALSQTGGSFHIIKSSHSGQVRIHINPFVLTEVARILRQKFLHKIDDTYGLISPIPLVIASNPSKKNSKSC